MSQAPAKLARAIHQGGPRCEAPFIHVGYAAYDAADLGDRIFVEPGDSRRSAWSCAENGTLYLESVDLLPPALQARLFDALAYNSQASAIDSKQPGQLARSNDRGQLPRGSFLQPRCGASKSPLRERTGDLGGIIETVRLA